MNLCFRAAALFTGTLLLVALAACGDSATPTASGSSLATGVSPVAASAKVCGKDLVAPTATPAVTATTGRVGPGTGLTHDGRRLDPQGRTTRVGNYPSGGALTPDGCYYWAVDAGFGDNDAEIVEVATGNLVQVLPMPGTYGQMVFSKDGTRAYVSGEKLGANSKGDGLLGTAGDVIHVFSVDKASGKAKELVPLTLPATNGGSGQLNNLNTSPQTAVPGFPTGLAVTPDGSKLVVALNSADKAVVVDTASGATTTLSTGKYPYAVALDRTGRYAYVSSELDGTLTKIDIAAASVVSTLNLGIPAANGGDAQSHPQALQTDPLRDRLYVALANRDLIAVFDTAQDKTTAFFDVGRSKDGIGTQPVALALAADGNTLYAAMSGENAITAIALGSSRKSAVEGTVIGKLPTLSYPTGVAVTNGGEALVWLSAVGFGSGSNAATPVPPAFPGADAVAGYTPKTVIGQVGVTARPKDADYAALTARVDATMTPSNQVKPPANTPLHTANGGASAQIKHVFYVIRENRTYDQIFGCDARGDGDCTLELFGDNGKTGLNAAATKGVTPNAHALTRTFGLLDHVYANSEVSVDGHVLVNSAYAINYVKKALHSNYSSRGKPFDMGLYPVTFPPKVFLYDQMVQKGITFRIYGEIFAGNLPTANDNRATYAQVAASFDAGYPDVISVASCVAQGTAECIYDSGMNAQPSGHTSRIDYFNAQFQAQLASNTVPQFNVLVLPNDHCGNPNNSNLSPNAMVADNDQAVGQLVQLISASNIWKDSAIFVIQDDVQAGSDHVDAHRMPVLVASPYARRGATANHTRYDHYSIIRTMELILGMTPLSLNDALAVPMYDVFTPTPDLTPFTAIKPEQSLTETFGDRGTMSAASLKLARTLPTGVDSVPEPLMSKLIWEGVMGAKRRAPPPGPNASAEELARDAAWRKGERRADID